MEVRGFHRDELIDIREEEEEELEVEEDEAEEVEAKCMSEARRASTTRGHCRVKEELTGGGVEEGNKELEVERVVAEDAC